MAAQFIAGKHAMAAPLVVEWNPCELRRKYKDLFADFIEPSRTFAQLGCSFQTLTSFPSWRTGVSA
eukprot:1158921-Pelagomonas_calceolata.AAC.16